MILKTMETGQVQEVSSPSAKTENSRRKIIKVNFAETKKIDIEHAVNLSNYSSVNKLELNSEK